MTDEFLNRCQAEFRREAELDQAEIFARLEGLPHQFDFFQAVRRLETWAAELGFPRIGYSQSRAGDPIHFGQRPFLEFAPRTIDFCNRQATDECRFARPVMLVYFLGLFGPNGPLPLRLTQLALERQRRGDYTITNFANALQHRFLCFFYRAWSCTRVAVDLDRPENQRFAGFVASVFGGGALPLQNRALEFQLGYRKKRAVPEEPQPAVTPTRHAPGRNGEWTRRTADWPKLYFAGRLACPTRNAEGLQAIIEEYFQLPALVLTFFGRYIALPPGSVCRLGLTPDASLMGQSLFAGESIWDCQMSFRLRLGPMTLADLERMLPGGASLERLKRWVFEYLSYELSWDVQLILHKDEVPETRLGSTGRLGWTTFLKSRPFEKDADTLVIATEE